MITWAYCSVCMDRTDHLAVAGVGLICLECHPEMDPRTSERDQNAIEKQA